MGLYEEKRWNQSISDGIRNELASDRRTHRALIAKKNKSALSGQLNLPTENKKSPTAHAKVFDESAKKVDW